MHDVPSFFCPVWCQDKPGVSFFFFFLAQQQTAGQTVMAYVDAAQHLTILNTYTFACPAPLGTSALHPPPKTRPDLYNSNGFCVRPWKPELSFTNMRWRSLPHWYQCGHRRHYPQCFLDRCSSTNIGKLKTFQLIPHILGPNFNPHSSLSPDLRKGPFMAYFPRNTNLNPSLGLWIPKQEQFLPLLSGQMFNLTSLPLPLLYVLLPLSLTTHLNRTTKLVFWTQCC